jgi:hypothetical protein
MIVYDFFVPRLTLQRDNASPNIAYELNTPVTRRSSDDANISSSAINTAQWPILNSFQHIAPTRSENVTTLISAQSETALVHDEFQAGQHHSTQRGNLYLAQPQPFGSTAGYVPNTLQWTFGSLVANVNDLVLHADDFKHDNTWIRGSDYFSGTTGTAAENSTSTHVSPQAVQTVQLCRKLTDFPTSGSISPSHESVQVHEVDNVSTFELPSMFPIKPPSESLETHTMTEEDEKMFDSWLNVFLPDAGGPVE